MHQACRYAFCSLITFALVGMIFYIRTPLPIMFKGFGEITPGAGTTRVTPLPTPKEHVYFMKTHKTGSSTLQNIFVRYAWKHGLVVGLPKGDNLFGSYYKGMPFSRKDMQPIPPNRTISMILHHMVFNSEEISSILPSDTVYVSILRDPATLFQSAFSYFRRDVKSFSRAASANLEGFLREPERYFKGPDDGRFWWLAKNGMFFDLGFDNMNETEEYMQQCINSAEKTFDLILITEYYDMGLILLKNMLHWNMTDIVYVSMNMRKSSNSKNTMSGDVTDKIYEWNQADTALYRHFNRTFWKRVKEFGIDRMTKELEELEALKKRMSTFCFEDDLISNRNVTDSKFKMFNPLGVDVAQYKLRESTKRNETCRGLILPELEWWRRLSFRQRPRYRKRTN